MSTEPTTKLTSPMPGYFWCLQLSLLVPMGWVMASIQLMKMVLHRYPTANYWVQPGQNQELEILILLLILISRVIYLTRFGLSETSMEWNKFTRQQMVFLNRSYCKITPFITPGFVSLYTSTRQSSISSRFPYFWKNSIRATSIISL